MLFGTILGSVTSSMLSGQFNDPILVPGIGSWRGIGGGVLLMFGARLGGGCTSGHGLTGFANLSVQSIIFTCCMFGSGIVVGMSYK